MREGALTNLNRLRLRNSSVSEDNLQQGKHCDFPNHEHFQPYSRSTAVQSEVNVGTTDSSEARHLFNQTDEQWIQEHSSGSGTLIGIYKARKRNYFPTGTPVKKLLNRRRRYVYKAYLREVTYEQAETFAARTQPNSWKWVPGVIESFDALYAAICRDDHCERRCPPGCNCEEGVCI